MRTVLIIEYRIENLEKLIGLCRLSSAELAIRSARNQSDAMAILDSRHIDLIICSTVLPKTQDCQVMATLARRYPYIPLIAIAPSQTVAKEQVKALGAAAFFEEPLKNEELLARMTELAETSSAGTVKSIPVHSFLQMLETEGKTCSLQVFSGDASGFIYIKDGEPINAEAGQLFGEDAFYEIISWNEVIIDIKFFNGLRDKNIDLPLISLIMEGFRLKDERQTVKKQEQTISNLQHKLHQVSTHGQRLALDIGLKMRLEFDAGKAVFDSVLIGMVPDNSVIVSTPSYFIVSQSIPVVGCTVIVKFSYLDKLCLFKSKLLRTIDTPQQMLFLEYPTVVHYHEMRKSGRAAVHIPCMINLGQDRFFGSFKDLSSAGGLCRIKRSRENNELPEIVIRQDVVVDCLLPGHKDEHSLRGKIINYKKNENEMQLGIEFSGLPDTTKEIIENLLQAIDHNNTAGVTADYERN